jgi:hypothetical protein
VATHFCRSTINSLLEGGAFGQLGFSMCEVSYVTLGGGETISVGKYGDRCAGRPLSEP